MEYKVKFIQNKLTCHILHMERVMILPLNNDKLNAVFDLIKNKAKYMEHKHSPPDLKTRLTLYYIERHIKFILII